MNSTRKLIVVFAATSLFVLAGFWMFRQRPIPSSLGEATAVWKWGMCRELRVDGNSDGRADLRGYFKWRWRTPDAHTPFVELWESLECDGVYDVRVEYETDGSVAVLNVDTDRDGEFEQVLTGSEGLERLEELRLDSRCLNWNQAK